MRAHVGRPGNRPAPRAARPSRAATPGRRGRAPVGVGGAGAGAGVESRTIRRGVACPHRRTGRRGDDAGRGRPHAPPGKPRTCSTTPAPPSRDDDDADGRD